MTALITGAAGAIGGACVRAFVDAGQYVIAHDLRMDSGLGEADSILAVEGDLREPAVLAELGRLADKHRVKTVVAAHGVAGSAELADCSPTFVAKVLAVNAETIPLLFDSTEQSLGTNRGSFIVVASQAALIGEAENTAYCAAKFAVLGWVRAMARTATAIRFHALCPGATKSPLLIAAQEKFAAAARMSPSEYYDSRALQIAVGRYGRPDEIAHAALYLGDRAGNAPTVLAVSGGDVMY